MTTKTTRAQRAIHAKTTSSLLVALLLAGGGAVLPAQKAAAAGKNRVPVQRICEGKVVDRGGQPVSNAVVYLEDPKSQAIRSYLSDEQGHFHFSQIQPDTDYELWAEANGKQTGTKRIGMFQTRATFEFTLKMKK